MLRPRGPARRRAGHPEGLLWYPYSLRRGRTVAALLRLLVARDVRRRLRGRGPKRDHTSLVSGAK
jgi:hypothetical protein